MHSIMECVGPKRWRNARACQVASPQETWRRFRDESGLEKEAFQAEDVDFMI